MARLVLLIWLLTVAAPLAAAPVLYRYDPVHTQVLFSVDHNGYSHPLGRLHVKGGWLRFDADDWSKSATALDIDLRGADMGDAGWNKAVRGRDLLDAAHSATAHFASSSVERTGPRTGVLHGDLTLRGRTRPVQVAFTLNRVGTTVFELHEVAGFSANANLDRYAFGMSSNPGSIGRIVRVRLEVEAIRDDDARATYEQGNPAHAASQ